MHTDTVSFLKANCVFFGGGTMIWMLILLIFTTTPVSGTELIFEMADRSGDDYGMGSLVYPTHDAFAPYRDLFDLTSFTVSIDGEYLLFDLSFSQITNPWKAPEGFFHQHILVFINTGNGTGVKRYDPLGFELNQPYDYVVRIAPWSLSNLRDYEGNIQAQLIVETIDPQTIRAYIPLENLHVPKRSWQYAVLVGSYDAFGRDLFREVLVKNTEWEFGGGGSWPFVDILAPSFGKVRQQEQLKSGVFYFQNHRGDTNPYHLCLLWLILVLLLFALGGCFFYRKRGFPFNLSLKFKRREHTTKGSITRWN